MLTEAICIDCGATFSRRREQSVRCPKCMKRLYKKMSRESKKQALEKLKKTTKPKVCPFCGAKYYGNRDYCATCLDEGFDEVHKMFGSTNGWDKKPRKVVEIKDGWRAGGVVGGNARGRIEW